MVLLKLRIVELKIPLPIILFKKNFYIKLHKKEGLRF